MDKKIESQIRTFSDMTKTIVLLGTVVVTITLYVHSTFATNNRVDKLEENQVSQKDEIKSQQKISCLIALKLKVPESDIKDMCHLHL